MYNLSFILLCLSTTMLIFMSTYIISIKNKSQIHHSFFYFILFMLFYSLACISERFSIYYFNYKSMIFPSIAYLGFTFLPVSFLFTGRIFANKNIKLPNILPWLIIPIISNIFVWTNNSHKLFYAEYYSLDSTKNLFGTYGLIHSIYSYTCILVGMYYLIRFSIKKSGLLSKQVLLIVIGTIVPLTVNIIYTTYVISKIKLVFDKNEFLYSSYSTPVVFSFAIICYVIAIMRYGFLHITPIALERVVDRISDALLIISSKVNNYTILDYNEPFFKYFNNILNIHRGVGLIDLVEKNYPILNIDKEVVKNKLEESQNKTNNLIAEELHIENKDFNFNKWFDVELSRIDDSKDLGTIILFKDMTQIKKSQQIIAKQERLATLGQLAGGMAHDIKNPTSAIRDGKDMLRIYLDKMLNDNISQENKQEIAENIKIVLNEIGECCSSIFTIVSGVRNHMRNVSVKNISRFPVERLVNNVQIIIDHIIKKTKCQLNAEYDPIEMNSDFGKLSQVLTNLILNACQAYAGKEGIINLSIKKHDDNALIKIEDFAGGIPEHIKNSIFKEMLTTKGTEGTGLGLYMCNSLVTAHLGGEIWFETEQGKGSTFYISVPLQLEI